MIRERLEAIVKKYGDARRTQLAQIEVPKEEKEIAEVVPVDVVVITTESGLIKKVPVSAFKVQKKGGKGVKSVDDVIFDVVKTNTVDYIMFFSNKGKMYRTIVDNIPDGTNTSKGVPIASLVKLENDEKIIAITSLHRKTLPKYIFFLTKNGIIKKSYLEEYTKTNKNAGIAALKVAEEDSVVKILFQDDEDIILVTKDGMNIRFGTTAITPIGRVAAGVKAIKLAEGDYVVSAMSVHKDTDQVAIFTSTGIGKKVALKEFLTQTRGGKGTIIYKTSTANGILIGATMVSDEDNVLICGNKTSICISAQDIPLLTKAGIGNMLIKDNKVISITKI